MVRKWLKIKIPGITSKDSDQTGFGVRSYNYYFNEVFVSTRLQVIETFLIPFRRKRFKRDNQMFTKFWNPACVYILLLGATK